MSKRPKLAERTLADGRTVVARVNGGIRKRCGCPPSGWNDCRHPWHANYSHDGIEHRVSLHKWAKKAHDYVMLQTEAKAIFRQWQNAIDAGKTTPAPSGKQTLEAVAARYITEYVEQPDRRLDAQKEMARQVRVLVKVFGSKPMAAITKPMIEDFRTARRNAYETSRVALVEVGRLQAAGQAVPDALRQQAQLAARSGKSGRVSSNRLLVRLRHLYVWAIEREMIDASPFTRAGVSVIKIDRKAESSRTRRLENDDENDRLLAHAGPHLRACIECTLETGMRRGEILGVQWAHVRLGSGIIELPASVTKTGISRVVVISSRLASILEMRRYAPDGREHGPDAYVFGDACGGRVKNIKTAWKLTCKRAGITGLRFHDLRRESGSRLLEAPGVSLTDVRDFLGHRDVSQTNTYLATTVQRQRAAIEKRDSARTNLAQTTNEAEHPQGVSVVTH